MALSALRRHFDTRYGRVVAVVLVAVAALGGGVLLARLAGVALRAADVGLSTGLAVLLSAVLVQGVALAGGTLLYLRARRLPLAWLGVSVPDFRGWLWVVSGYVAALLSAFALVLLVVLSGLQPAANRAGELGQQNPDVLPIFMLASLLLIGPGEELLFRGVVQGTLREKFSAPAAVGLATALFAAAHFTSLSGAIGGRALTVTLLFVPGLVFGVVYEVTDNIVVPALVHGLYNATLFGLAYVSLQYGAGNAPAGNAPAENATAAVVAVLVGLP